MKYRLLDFLLCPDCSQELHLNVFKEEKVNYAVQKAVKTCVHYCALKNCLKGAKTDSVECGNCYQLEIKEGVLECGNNHLFPIVDYIPRMLPDAFCSLERFIGEYKHYLPVEMIKNRMEGVEVKKFRGAHKNTGESFGYEWLRYKVDLQEEDRAILLEDSQIPEDYFKDKVILDAGCGMGRYTRTAGAIGGEIIGVDLSQSVAKAYHMTCNNPCAHIIQGNILKLPLREKQFDIIYSFGVLHHTPDSRQGFLKLTKLLKENGIISIWVYGTAGRYHDFKTNPLREDRREYTKSTMAKRVHWCIVYSREMLSNAVRLVTTRMYVPFLYLLCYPLAAIGKIPLVRYLTASVHTNWRVRLLENFDWFSPQYQSHHTKEEVSLWFKEAKLKDISMLQHGFIPKVGFRGTLR